MADEKSPGRAEGSQAGPGPGQSQAGASLWSAGGAAATAASGHQRLRSASSPQSVCSLTVRDYQIK